MVASVARTVGWSGRVPLRTAATGVSGARPPSTRRRAIVADAARAHEDHERAAGARQRVPVDVGAALGRVLVAGDHGEVGGQAAVGHRDAGVRGGADRAGDAGHHLERDAGRGERLGLLAAAPEHERVAALQPHDARPARPCSTSTALISSWVRSTSPGALPAAMSSAPGRREVEQRRRRQPVVHDDVGAAEQLGAAHGEQPRVTRARAHEVDGHAAPPPSSELSSSSQRPPWSRSSAATARPATTGSVSARVRAEHDVPVERGQQHLDRDLVAVDAGERAAREVAPAAQLGEERALGVDRRVRVARRRSRRPRRASSSSSARHSTASAPCPTCGSIDRRLEALVGAVLEPEPVERGGGDDDRVELGRPSRAGWRCCRAARRT